MRSHNSGNIQGENCIFERSNEKNNFSKTKIYFHKKTISQLIGHIGLHESWATCRNISNLFDGCWHPLLSFQKAQMIYSERSSCQGQVCLQLCCSVVVELREQNYSHREGVETQRREKGPVSVVFDFTWSGYFVILLHTFLKILTVYHAVNNCFCFCFFLVLNTVFYPTTPHMFVIPFCLD